VLGERWTFLILREAFLGATKFAEFRDRLGIAPDVLSDRLSTLVEYGVMEREPYQDPGARPRSAYRLTPAGTELKLVLHALQQWGDKYLPRPEGPSVLRRIRGTGLPVHVGYVDDRGSQVALADVAVIPADPTTGLASTRGVARAEAGYVRRDSYVALPRIRAAVRWPSEE
jgi:DNA-binding HxlR family transcriptional regulator